MDILFISQVSFLQEAMVATLQAADGNRAIGAASQEAVSAALTESEPSLVIVDASHPQGMALVAGVRAYIPTASVIVLAPSQSDENFLAWADIGISGYLGPDTSVHDLLSAVRRVGAGEVACPPRLTALLLNRCASRSDERATRAGIYVLTAREREIAELLADGLSNKLIARRLQVALPTVKNHVHSILDKWDVRSRGEAAARYRQKAHETIMPSAAKSMAVRPGHVSHLAGSNLRSGDVRHGVSPASAYRAA